MKAHPKGVAVKITGCVITLLQEADAHRVGLFLLIVYDS
jgi:hypothetical protein